MNRKLRSLLLFFLITSSAIAQSYHNEWIDYSKTYYKFKVFGFGADATGAPIPKGMVRIPYTSLAAAGLGAASSESFQLWRDGQEVAVYVSKSSGPLTSTDYIEFWGEINNGKLDKELYRNVDYQLADKWSLQTDTASYFLTINTSGVNKRLTPVNNNVASNTLPATNYFMHTVGRYFRAGEISNGFSASAGENLYSSSYDKGEGWVSRSIRPVACGTQGTLPQNFSNLYPYLSGPNMTMRINAVGNQQNSRSVRVNLNGDSVTTFQMDYINYVKDEEYLPVSEISSGSASFQVVNQSPSACDEMKVAMIELTYPRTLNFGGASVFEFSLPLSYSGRYLAIANFNPSGVAPVLYDLSNGKRYVGDISNPDTVKVLLDPSTTQYNLVLTTQAGSYYKSIATIQPRNFIDFSSAANQGDYLIISNPLIYGSGAANYVEQYKQYRSSATGGNYNAKVVDINELVDQFAWGVKKHPLSIKNFLRYARNNFATAPKYAFLIGKGVMYQEYRSNESDPLIEQLNLVPTWGNPASDNLLASNDFTAIPATAIGRLSAVTPQEVGDYLLKVKQYDSAQKSTVNTLAGKGWMKNVLQIAGANDLSLGSKLDGYLNGYKAQISDTSFGAKVTDFSKTADPGGYTDAVLSFKNIYEHGSSLITYFGHSSATSLDFNLDNPDTYNNQSKYPFFIANGCNAGNHFTFESNRFNNKSTISERFVLAPQRGAIGYIASTNFGVVNYLDLYTREFYKAIGKTQYNQSIGNIMKEAIARALDSTGSLDFYARVHAEQYAYHGDPAITFNSAALPDYVVEEAQMQVTPSFISVADTSFFVKVKVNNIGKAVSDSVTFKLTRQFPNGKMATVFTKKLAPLYNTDSVLVEVPIVSNKDEGENKLIATLDYNNEQLEITRENNSATKTIIISSDEIRPVYPYNYSIVNQPNQILKASTVNPLSPTREYIMEMDTTELFNSPVKVVKTKTSSGGVIEFEPAVTYQNGTTYYWRVAPNILNNLHWSVASFVYQNTSTGGMQQGHIYQNLKSDIARLSIDSASGKYSYLNKTQNLFVTHSIYPTSGTEDMHFSVSVNGSAIIRSACIGSSVIFNVFDSLTFQPWMNTTQPFGAAAPCLTGREYNFEYSYTSSSSRKNAMDFLDAVPKGDYVVARAIYDNSTQIFANVWAADTTIFGRGNSLYHRLKQQGFSAIDSFSYPRTWAFVFRKDDTTFTPRFVFTQGLYDRVNLSVDCVTRNDQGDITSPKFGRAKAWKNVTWSGYSDETGNDIPTVDVIGVDVNNRDTVLYSLNNTQHVFSIAGIDAAKYPYVKLRMSNKDTVTATPYQLTQWNVEYVPVAEGAIAPNLYFNIPDTIGYKPVGQTTSADSLHIGVAFKNVSNVNMDSVALKVVLYDTIGNAIEYPVYKLRGLPAGDTMNINLTLNVGELISGLYNAYVYINPNVQQPEQLSFNNFFYKYVYINRSGALPVTFVSFNASRSGNNVQAAWQVASEANVKQYVVQHSTSGMNFKDIGQVPVSNSATPNNHYIFNHINAPHGRNYYRLKMLDNDGTFKYSEVRLVTIESKTAINVYPNPVVDILNIAISSADGKPSDVKLMDMYGQQLWHGSVNGTAQINTKAWARGTYILQVNEGDRVYTFKVSK
jgi:hypothetical protein